MISETNARERVPGVSVKKLPDICNSIVVFMILTKWKYQIFLNFVCKQNIMRSTRLPQNNYM